MGVSKMVQFEHKRPFKNLGFIWGIDKTFYLAKTQDGLYYISDNKKESMKFNSTADIKSLRWSMRTWLHQIKLYRRLYGKINKQLFLLIHYAFCPLVTRKIDKGKMIKIKVKSKEEYLKPSCDTPHPGVSFSNRGAAFHSPHSTHCP